MTMLQKVETF